MAMTRSDNLYALPAGLPIPEDDGACDHLPGLKRITLVARDGTIEKVFYPVFPPDRNADEVAAWLRGHP